MDHCVRQWRLAYLYSNDTDVHVYLNFSWFFCVIAWLHVLFLHSLSKGQVFVYFDY